MTRRGTEDLEEDLRKQAKFLSDKVAVYTRILDYVRSWTRASGSAERAIVERLGEVWKEREFFAWYERPLLLLASIRADALRSGTSHPLYSIVGDASGESVAPEAVLAAFDTARASFWRDVRDRRVQTNETSRAVAWLWPASLAGCDAGRRPLVLLDIGASAGLNLVADRLPAMWTDETGGPLPVARYVRSPRRIAIDRRPVDVSDPEEVAWLRACVWPSDHERLARLDAAIRAMHDMRVENFPAELVAMDVMEAPALLRRLLQETPRDAFVLAYQTVMREYLSPEVLQEYTRSMQSVLHELGAGRAAWIELETGPAIHGVPPAAVYAHTRGADGVITLILARCSYHPTVVQIDPESVTRFTDAVG